MAEMTDMSGWDEKRKRLHYLEWRGCVFHSVCKAVGCKNSWIIKSTDADYGRKLCETCAKSLHGVILEESSGKSYLI